MLPPLHCCHSPRPSPYGNPAHRWFVERENEGLHLGPKGTVFLSAMSIAAIQWHIRQAPAANITEQNLRTNVLKLIERLEIADSVVGVDVMAIRFWIERLGKKIPGLGFEGQLVLSTAATGINGRDCVLVDRETPLHKQLGIRVHVPQ